MRRGLVSRLFEILSETELSPDD